MKQRTIFGELVRLAPGGGGAYEIRSYPMCCRSLYCGKSGDDCNAACPNFDELQRFLAWRAETGAVEIDPDRSPGLYRGRP